MNEIIEILRLLIMIKDNPLLILSLLLFCALALAGWAIYALIVVSKHSNGGK